MFDDINKVIGQRAISVLLFEFLKQAVWYFCTNFIGPNEINSFLILNVTE